MKLKKYMIIDLLMLIGIGFVIEALGIFVFNKMLTATMITTAISLLIMMISITRWRWKGLVVAPFLALATILSGRFFNDHLEYRGLYNWQLYISTFGSLLSMAVNLLWFKYIDYRRTFKSVRLTLLLCLIDVVISQLALSLLFLAFTGQFFMLGFLAWNSFSFVILVVGVFCLRKQNVLIDVVADLEEKNQEIKDADFRMNIEEVVEKEKGDFKDGESS